MSPVPKKENPTTVVALLSSGSGVARPPAMGNRGGKGETERKRAKAQAIHGSRKGGKSQMKNPTQREKKERKRGRIFQGQSPS